MSAPLSQFLSDWLVDQKSFEAPQIQVLSITQSFEGKSPGSAISYDGDKTGTGVVGRDGINGDKSGTHGNKKADFRRLLCFCYGLLLCELICQNTLKINMFGGEGGIRTRGGMLSHTRFPGRLFKWLYSK